MMTTTNKDKAIYEKWIRGNLEWKMHQAQKEINKKYKESTGTLFVGNCARQWGKSFWAICKAVEYAIANPKSQIRYGAAFQTDLVTFIIPTLNKVMEDCPQRQQGKFNRSRSTIEFTNGSIIKFVGIDKNPNGLRGSTLDLIILDEVGFTSNLDYIYKSIIIPATTHRPNAKVIMISTPPSTPAHDFCDYVEKAKLEGGYGEFNIYANPLIDEITIARLMRESGGEFSTTWLREYMCQFVVDSNLCLIPEWKDEYVQTPILGELYQFYHRYVGMDLGRKDHTALCFGYYDFRNATLFIQDEMTMQGDKWTTETLVEDLKEKEKSIWNESPVERRISDNNNPHLIIDLAHLHGINFIETSKESLEAMINEVRILVGAGRIIVDPKCHQLIGCLKFGVWDEKRDKFSRSKVYGHFDMLAALVYLVRNLNKNTNPIPVNYGFETHKSWINNPGTNVSQNAKTMGSIFKVKR